MSEDPEGGIHLLLADDTVSAGHRGRRSLPLCNQLVPLVSEHCLPECDREHFLCPQCVSEATIWSADPDDRQAARQIPPDGGSRSAAGVPAPGVQDDEGEVAGYFIGECGHPAPLVGPVWRVGPCGECDPGAT